MRALIITLLVALLACGCATSSGGGGINEVQLFGLPITLNLDNVPGADGFAARVYAVKSEHPKGIAVQNGKIEVLMFDGVVSVDDVFTKPAMQTWSYTSHELRALGEQSSLGQGYRFVLRWNAPPKRGHITIVARYVPEKGQAVYSAPSSITASAK